MIDNMLVNSSDKTGKMVRRRSNIVQYQRLNMIGFEQLYSAVAGSWYLDAAAPAEFDTAKQRT